MMQVIEVAMMPVVKLYNYGQVYDRTELYLPLSTVMLVEVDKEQQESSIKQLCAENAA